ncbi:MAG: NAD(P)H-hydrate dehydratase [Bdellovibrionales bacterium]
MLENSSALWLEDLPRPQVDGHKYDRGHTVIVGGYPLTGAARLAAMAAARIGSGLTTILAPEDAFPVYAAALTSIMVKPFSSRPAFRKLVSEIRATAFLLGPGAGTGAETREQALTLLATGTPLVLDADGLNVFSGEPSLLANARKGPVVLTPHEGEYARLFGPVTNREKCVLSAATQTGAIVVLKGHSTLIGSPDGALVCNVAASPDLATAGSGDVLSGLKPAIFSAHYDSPL